MKSFGFLIILTQLLIGSFAVAYDDACNSTIKPDSYVQGSYNSSNGSKNLYNFSKIRKDIKESLLADSFDQKKSDCLSDFYEKAQEDSSTYWAGAIARNGCSVDKKIPDTRPEGCSEDVWNEYHKSKAYLSGLDNQWQGQLKKLVAQAKEEAAKSCGNCGTHKQQFAVAQLTATELKSRMCCGTETEKSGAVRGVYPDISYNSCIEKTTEAGKDFDKSSWGHTECLYHIVLNSLKRYGQA